MNELEQVLEEIRKQQAGKGEFSPVYQVGEQLKEILGECPEGAALVLADFGAKGMGIGDCERKIEEFARSHKSGNCGCCPPKEADRIIREFYGLPKRTESAAKKPELPKTKRISLTDFLC